MLLLTNGRSIGGDRPHRCCVTLLLCGLFAFVSGAKTGQVHCPRVFTSPPLKNAPFCVWDLDPSLYMVPRACDRFIRFCRVYPSLSLMFLVDPVLVMFMFWLVFKVTVTQEENVC